MVRISTLIAVLLLSACISGAPSARMNADVSQLIQQPRVYGGDTLELNGRVGLQNLGSAALAFDNFVRAPVALEFHADGNWHPALVYAPIVAGAVWRQRVKLMSGDSLTLSVRELALRGVPRRANERVLELDRWLGPIPGTYRFRMRLYKCDRKGDLACPIDVVSAPFEIRP